MDTSEANRPNWHPKCGHPIFIKEMVDGQAAWIVPWVLYFCKDHFYLWDIDHGWERPGFETQTVKITKQDGQYKAEPDPNDRYDLSEIWHWVQKEDALHPHRTYIELIWAGEIPGEAESK